MLLAALLTGAAAAGLLRLLQGVLPAGKAGELLSLALCALSGAAVYFLAARALGLQEAKLAFSLVKRIGKRG